MALNLPCLRACPDYDKIFTIPATIQNPACDSIEGTQLIRSGERLKGIRMQTWLKLNLNHGDGPRAGSRQQTSHSGSGLHRGISSWQSSIICGIVCIKNGRATLVTNELAGG
ncbi:MAG TPA: hypothetical protein DIT89_05550 [Planctomycetaceae bacterium]|nr:hypothetical protein [Planctomycetaceae bacterium]